MKKEDLVYTGSERRLSGYDLSIPENFNGILIYFIHGYKGYKNWGAWDLISDYFYDLGYGFAKCNLSHNGTSLKTPNNFVDLDAFAHNRYTFELDDILAFIKTVEKNDTLSIKKRVLIGHSRGGGDVILAAKENPEIDLLITWAAISDIKSRFLKEEALKNWKNTGVYTVLNGRTKQHMPHNYSFYEDFLANTDRLNIKEAAQDIHIPWAIIHGNKDTSVLPAEGQQLLQYNSKAQLYEIEHANHVFGAKEPYTNSELPEHTKQLVKITRTFIEDNI